MATSFVVRLPGQSPVTLTAGGWCSPCEAQKLQAQTEAIQKSYQIDPDATALTAASPNEARWTGELGYENEFTGDGRFINLGALRWDAEQMPMPLRWAPTDLGGHGGAMVIGLIDKLEVVGGKVMAEGFIDTSTEYGLKAFNGLKGGTLKGVSLDLDDMDMEVRVKEELIKAADAAMEALFEGSAEMPEREKADENGYVKVYEGSADDEVMYVTDARVRAATLVDIPAFANAYVALVDGEEAVTASAEDSGVVALAASAAPVAPPAAWFANPQLTEPTPLTFTDDGRVYGHIATWGTCHTGYSGACVTPPTSNTNYAYFRTGVLLTEEGTEVAVGRLTIDTGHADPKLAMSPAVSHYDDTGVAAADCSAGEDAFGIWISGAIRSTVTDEQLRVLRASPMSGDWRTAGGNLELCAVLGVNMPGFPVPRTRALVASGRTATLITSTVPVEAEMSAVKGFAARAQALTVRGWADAVGAE